MHFIDDSQSLREAFFVSSLCPLSFQDFIRLFYMITSSLLSRDIINHVTEFNAKHILYR